MSNALATSITSKLDRRIERAKAGWKHDVTVTSRLRSEDAMRLGRLSGQYGVSKDMLIAVLLEWLDESQASS
jgi:hypothetical protein